MNSAVLEINYGSMSFSFFLGESNMNSDYRVVLNEDELFTIYEVYYDQDGNIEDWDDTVVCAIGSDLEDLKIEVEKMTAALSRPVLCMDDNGNLVEYVEKDEDEDEESEDK